MIPVLIGMKDDPMKTKLSYESWFNEQDRNTQIDIVGPARYKEYLKGKAVTYFAKDGRVMSLKELGLDRITRQTLYETIYKKYAKPYELTEEEIKNLYNNKMTDEELQKAFKKRYPHIEVDIVGKMPKKQMQLLFRTYDNLLQKYPVCGKLMSIEVVNLTGKYGKYIPAKSIIQFDKKLVNNNVYQVMKNRTTSSTNKENHTYIHEFGHALGNAIRRDGKNGR